MSAPPRRRPRLPTGAPKPPRAKRRDTGGAFERAVFAALDECVRAGVFMRWDHFGPKTKRLSPAQVIVTGKAPPDVVATTSEGWSYAAEVKHDQRRVYVAADVPKGDRSARVEAHQAAYLNDVASTAHGTADLIVCVAGAVAVIPWVDVRTRAWLDRDAVLEFAATDSDPWFCELVRRHMRLEGM